MRAGPVAVAALATALAACTPTSPEPAPSTTAPAAAASPVATVAAAAPVASPTPAALAWGPLESQWDEALEAARGLTLREAAGQVIVADVYRDDADFSADLVERWHLGGVILMDGSVTDREGVSTIAAAVQDADDRAWPVWVSGDEEGGVVSRLGPVVRSMPAFMAAGAASDKGAVEAAYAGLAADLGSVGVTVDYAPVADVTIGSDDPTIRSRSAGSDPDHVARTVTAAVDGFLAGGTVPVVKHFPGHGSVTVDSHHDLPVQQASVAELEERDLVPFAAAVEAGTPAIMVGHIAVPEWGDEAATLEPEAYAYLRDELGFAGVAVTDALNMGAITDRHPDGEAAVMALRAGADVLLMPRSVEAAVDAIVAAVKDGSLSRERLDEAAARSIALMLWAEDLAAAADDAAGTDYARELAVAGATVATDDCDAPLIGDSAVIVGGTDTQRAWLRSALEKHGVDEGRDTVIALVPSGAYTATADVVVSLDSPWGLGRSDASVYVGLYGGSTSAMRALADVLVGAAEPGGDWPVAMPAVPASCAA